MGTGTIPTPEGTTIVDLNDSKKAEPMEGKLVTVKGKVTSIPSAPDTSMGSNITISDESGKTLNVRVMQATDITLGTDIKVNSSYEFTGIVSQYASASPYLSGYQLLTRSKEDLKEYFPLTIDHTPVTTAYKNTDITLSATILGADEANLYYKKTGTTNYQSIAMTKGENNLYTATIVAADVPADSFDYYIEAKNQSTTKSSGTADAPNTVSVVEDTVGPQMGGETPANTTIVETKRPEIAVQIADPSGIDETKTIVTLDGTDVTSSSTLTDGKISVNLANDLTIGVHEMKVTASDKLGNQSEYTWSFTVAEPFTGGTHLRGTTHNHTNISHDGSGAPEDALKAAKVHGYDWFAFSDHSHDIDPEKLGADTADHKGMPERTGGTEWQLTKDLAKEYSNNDFTVFPAFEMTSTTWGHSNVFGTDNFIDRNINGKMYQNLDQYYAWVMTYDDIVAQFNHPTCQQMLSIILCLMTKK